MKLWSLVLLSLLLCNEVAAASLRQDSAFWAGLDYDTAISETKPIYFDVMLQSRFSDSHNTLDEFFVRPSLTYRFPSRLRLSIGYDFIPTYPDARPSLIEQRIWPQLQKAYELKPGLDLTLRTRLEYRVQTNQNSSAVRFRQRIEFAYQVPETRWIIDMFDELFLGVKKPNWVTARTVDQNRIFFGLARKLNRYIQLDMGYMTIYRPRDRSRFTHIPILALEVGLDRKAVRVQSI